MSFVSGCGFEEVKGETIHHKELRDILGVSEEDYRLFFNRVKNILKKANGYKKE